MNSRLQVEEGHVWPEASSLSLLWNIYSFLTIMGISKSKVDPNLYFKVIEDEPVILLLYVDDLFLTGNEKQIMESKNKLAE